MLDRKEIILFFMWIAIIAGIVLFVTKYRKQPNYDPHAGNHTLHERIVIESNRIQIEENISNIIERLEKVENKVYYK